MWTTRRDARERGNMWRKRGIRHHVVNKDGRVELDQSEKKGSEKGIWACMKRGSQERKGRGKGE